MGNLTQMGSGAEFWFFTVDRAPASSEPTIVTPSNVALDTVIGVGFPIFVVDTTTEKFYRYKSGLSANNDLVWASLSGTTPPARSFSYTARSLDTVYQLSTTRDVLVNYSIDIAATLSLTGGQTGTVFLEIADDNGFTTNVQEINRSVNGNTGTPTFTYRSGQETLL